MSSRDSLHRALVRIMSLPEDTFNTSQYEVLSEEEADTYTRTRLSYHVREDEYAAAYLLKPKAVVPPYPVMICLQGHSPGMYISIGEVRSEQDKRLIAGGICHRTKVLRAAPGGR